MRRKSLRGNRGPGVSLDAATAERASTIMRDLPEQKPEAVPDYAQALNDNSSAQTEMPRPLDATALGIAAAALHRFGDVAASITGRMASRWPNLQNIQIPAAEPEPSSGNYPRQVNVTGVARPRSGMHETASRVAEINRQHADIAAFPTRTACVTLPLEMLEDRGITASGISNDVLRDLRAMHARMPATVLYVDEHRDSERVNTQEDMLTRSILVSMPQTTSTLRIRGYGTREKMLARAIEREYEDVAESARTYLQTQFSDHDIICMKPITLGQQLGIIAVLYRRQQHGVGAVIGLDTHTGAVVAQIGFDNASYRTEQSALGELVGRMIDAELDAQNTY